MPVTHNIEGHQFWIEPQPGLRGELDYALSSGTVNFHHTGVHPGLRGQGIAALLVEAGLAWAASQGLRVIPGCSYVATYLERNSKWAHLLA